MISSYLFSVTGVLIGIYFALFKNGYFYKEVLDVQDDLPDSDAIPQAMKNDGEDATVNRELIFFLIFLVAPCILLLVFIGRLMQKSLDRVLYPDDPTKVTRSHARCEKVDKKKISRESNGGAKESSANEGSMTLADAEGKYSKEANSSLKLRDSTILEGEKLIGSSKVACGDREVLGDRSKIPDGGVSQGNPLLLRENQDKRKVTKTAVKARKHTHKRGYNVSDEDSGEEVTFHMNDVYLISQALNSADKSSDDLSE